MKITEDDENLLLRHGCAIRGKYHGIYAVSTPVYFNERCTEDQMKKLLERLRVKEKEEVKV